MNRKALTTFILLTILVVVIFVVALPREKKKVVHTQEEVASFTWGDYMDEAYKVLKKTYKDVEIRDQEDILVVQEADLNTDGTPEILIDFASAGAAVDSVALLELRDGRIHASEIELETGEVIPARFVEGSTSLSASSVGISGGVIYQGNVVYDPQTLTLSICEVSGYTWSELKQRFVFDDTRSTEIEVSFCSSKVQQIGE